MPIIIGVLINEENYFLWSVTYRVKWLLHWSCLLSSAFNNLLNYYEHQIKIAGLSGRSPAEIAGSNSTGNMEVCLLWALFCQVDVSATSWSLVHRSPTDCGVSLCVI
jgi:hypothetical protein